MGTFSLIERNAIVLITIHIHTRQQNRDNFLERTSELQINILSKGQSPRFFIKRQRKPKTSPCLQWGNRIISVSFIFTEYRMLLVRRGHRKKARSHVNVRSWRSDYSSSATRRCLSPFDSRFKMWYMGHLTKSPFYIFNLWTLSRSTASGCLTSLWPSLPAILPCSLFHLTHLQVQLLVFEVRSNTVTLHNPWWHLS